MSKKKNKYKNKGGYDSDFEGSKKSKKSGWVKPGRKLSNQDYTRMAQTYDYDELDEIEDSAERR